MDTESHNGAESHNGSAMDGDRSSLQDRAGEQLEAAREALDGLDKKVRTFVKERPGVSLAGAIALGFIFGRLVSRR